MESLKEYLKLEELTDFIKGREIGFVPLAVGIFSTYAGVTNMINAKEYTLKGVDCLVIAGVTYIVAGSMFGNPLSENVSQDDEPKEKVMDEAKEEPKE